MICVERKTRLDGSVVCYECELRRFGPEHGVLSYFMPESRKVGDLFLERGTETLAVYWPTRNYNLYCWVFPELDPADPSERVAFRPLAYYFNIVDSVSLSPTEFAYRDLAVDLLVSPSGVLSVLDEDELPAGLDDSVRGFVGAMKRQIVAGYSDIIAEATRILLPIVAGH